MEGGALASTMIKQLASCNKGAREKSLKLLKSWLPLQHEVSEEEMKKIWKGLFYCVWHADKAPVQADLNDRLSSFLLRLHRPLASCYVSVFFLTMHREWSGIDSLRLDKFYLLIRRFLHYLFAFLKASSWDFGVTHEFVGVLEERTFLAEGKFPSNGVSYHVASVFLEELRPFLPLSLEILEVLFLPFLSVMGRSKDKVLVGKVKGCVFDVLLNWGRNLLEVKKSGEDIDASNDVVILGTIALTMDFSRKLYDLGSSEDCVQGSRKVLFSLHGDFLKLKKDLEDSGIEVSIPEVNNDENEEEVPSLVPIDTSMEGGAPEEVRSLVPIDTSMDGGAPEGASHDSTEGVSGDSTFLVANGPAKIHAKKKRKKAKKEKMAKEEGPELVVGVREEVKAIENVAVGNGETSVEKLGSDDSSIEFNETVISNLQMQFEKVAADAGMDKVDASLGELSKITANGHVPKKRKRAKSLNGKDSKDMDLSCEGHEVGEKSAVKSSKKVKFSMKSNLVWKPHTPLPPQSLRLPPSVTPRGSALKKGVPPGPIREMQTAAKRSKAKVKKGRKSLKSISPASKRLKKLKSVSV